MMQEYIIPRNINVKEGFVGNLGAKQVLFLIVGGAGAVGIWSVTGGLDTAVRLAGCIFSFGGALAITLMKVEGQTLDQYAGNMMKYPLRKKTFEEVVEDVTPKTAPTVRVGYSLS